MALLSLAACGRGQEPRAAWRGEAEVQCLRSGAVHPSATIRQMSPINPGGTCGADYPFKVEALPLSNVRFNRAIPMNCPLIRATDDWLEKIVQPAAMRQFGQRVVEVDTYGTYNCRRILNRSYGQLSEHAFVNAIDVSGFVLEDGRKLRVGKADAPPHWPYQMPNERALGVSMAEGGLDLLQIGPGLNGAPPLDINFGGDSKPFWRMVRDGACTDFTTVLGPGTHDGQHEDHLHLDLAHHGRSGQMRVCR